MQVQTFDTKYGADKYLMLEAEQLPAIVTQQAHELRRRNTWGDWSGDSFLSFQRKVATGDESLVAESESMLSKLEDQIPHSKGWRVMDDVVGALPNVPAMLAGVPQSMRRRERTRKDNAPLTIYMDLTSSGGISSRAIQQRGITLLALTRVLVEHRAVTLWVGASLGSSRLSGTCAWRVDTAPMDLARAAYHIGATAMSRGFGYGMCQSVMTTHGGWPFDNYDLHCRTAQERLAAVFPGTEIKYIPPIYLNDALTADPVGWVKRVLNITEQED